VAVPRATLRAGLAFIVSARRSSTSICTNSPRQSAPSYAISAIRPVPYAFGFRGVEHACPPQLVGNPGGPLNVANDFAPAAA
jgi:hypothetical protein